MYEKPRLAKVRIPYKWYKHIKAHDAIKVKVYRTLRRELHEWQEALRELTR